MLITLAGLLGLAQAKDHDSEVVPEFDAFIKLSKDVRLFLLADITQGLSPSYANEEIGAHLDFTLKPLLRRELRDGNWERERFLWVRTGYVVEHDSDNDSKTQTILLEMTGRFELPAKVFWLVNRARMDFGDIEGEYSRRYRFRAAIEREFKVCGVTTVPYVQAEIFYDTRYHTLNRQLYQIGVEIELNEHWRIEPYVARQNDSRSASGNVNRLGLAFKAYF